MKKIIIRTLNSLEDEYKKLTIVIRTHDSLMSFEELYDKLINHETYLR